MDEYFIQSDHGDPTGPYPEARVRTLIKNGIVKSHHRLKSLDNPTWTEASSLFPELFPSSPVLDTDPIEPDSKDDTHSPKEWFYAVDSNQADPDGPVSTETLQSLAREGAIDPTAKIWKEGWPDWRDAADVSCLAGLWPIAPGSSTTGGPEPSSDALESAPPRMTTSAISSLILGLSSIMFAGGNMAAYVFQQWALLIVFGLVFLLTSILAVVLGHLSLSTIKKQPDRWTGRGIGISGMILGYVSLAATAIIAVVLLFVVVLQVGQIAR